MKRGLLTQSALERKMMVLRAWGCDLSFDSLPVQERK
jgi:hypothetical protein